MKTFILLIIMLGSLQLQAQDYSQWYLGILSCDVSFNDKLFSDDPDNLPIKDFQKHMKKLKFTPEAAKIEIAVYLDYFNNIQDLANMGESNWGKTSHQGHTYYHTARLIGAKNKEMIKNLVRTFIYAEEIEDIDYLSDHGVLSVSYLGDNDETYQASIEFPAKMTLNKKTNVKIDFSITYEPLSGKATYLYYPGKGICSLKKTIKVD